MPPALRDMDLLRDRGLVDGAWVEADDGRRFDVCDPATGELVGTVPRMGAAETRRAIAAAERAQPAWRATSARDRARILRRWADLLVASIDDLAALLTAEQGKPLAESRAEVEYAASFLEWFGEEGKRVYGDTIPSPLGDRRIIVVRQPVGTTAGITPWNFPAAMPTRKAAPALAAGCTMVLKPAEQTPLTALAVGVLAERAGLPPGVLRIVTGDAEDAPLIGGEMTSNPAVRKVGFTGSTEVGKLLMAQCAKAEAGLARARRQRAVHRARRLQPRRRGRRRAAVQVPQQRPDLHLGQPHPRAGRRLRRVRRAPHRGGGGLRVGLGTEPGVQVGPLIDEAALQKVQRHVDDARERGGELLTGGTAHELGRTFFTPTVLTGATADWAMSTRRRSARSRRCSASRGGGAVRIANDTPYGLSAYLYSRDVGRIWRVRTRSTTASSASTRGSSRPRWRRSGA